MVTDDSRAAALITADELATLLAADRPPTLLDVRWRLGGTPGRELYQAGHIPGAAFIDLDLELAAIRSHEVIHGGLRAIDIHLQRGAG